MWMSGSGGHPADYPKYDVRPVPALSGSPCLQSGASGVAPQLPFTEGAQHGLVRLETWSAVESMLFGLALFRRVGPWDLVCVRLRRGRIRINRWPANSICYGDADHIGIR